MPLSLTHIVPTHPARTHILPTHLRPTCHFRCRLQLTIQLTGRGSARIRVGFQRSVILLIADKFAVNVSQKLSEKWNAPLSLNVPDLALYLSEPLPPDEKIPISSKNLKMLLLEDLSLPEHYCRREDLGALFTESEDETANFIWSPLQSAILSPEPDSSGTEESYISFWDRNIRDILSPCLGRPKWIRNSNRGTRTGSLRPDSALLLQSICVFRGEEKKPTFTGKHPRAELAEKTQWVYEPALYVLGMQSCCACTCC